MMINSELIPHPLEDEDTIEIADGNEIMALDYAGAQAYHKGNSWWGVAVGFRAMQAAAGTLSGQAIYRNDLSVVSGHPGPGVRDAIDYVTRCVKNDCYSLTKEQSDKVGCSRDMNYQWWVSDGKTTAVISLREDFVPEPFGDLLDRLGSENERNTDREQFDAFKLELAERIWADALERNFRTKRLPSVLKRSELPSV